MAEKNGFSRNKFGRGLNLGTSMTIKSDRWIIEKAESGMIHEATARSLVSSASFCARTVSSEGATDGNGFRLNSVKMVDVEVEEDGTEDEEQLSQIEKLKSKCTCTIL